MHLDFRGADTDKPVATDLQWSTFSQLVPIRFCNVSDSVVDFDRREMWAPKESCVCCSKVLIFQDVTLTWCFIDAMVLHCSKGSSWRRGQNSFSSLRLASISGGIRLIVVLGSYILSFFIASLCFMLALSLNSSIK